MYQTAGPRLAYSDAMDNPDQETADASANVHMVKDDPENFDLYEWALEFSKAVGFEVERVPFGSEE